VDENGVFQSVEVNDPGGKLTVNAKCVLLASGGFSHNERIMRRVRPSFFEGLPVHSFTVASNTGDAIDMAEEIGAKLDFQHIKSPLFGPVHHPYNFGVVSLCNDPRIAMVNINGRRFKNEGAPPEGGGQFGPLEDQPQKKAYAIFDAPTAEAMGEELIRRSQHDPGMLQGMVTWKEQLEYECAELDIAAHKADSLEELAKLAGISPVGLKDEIEKYNMFCHQQKDEDFDKPTQFLSPVEQGPLRRADAPLQRGQRGGSRQR
jgi:succinate dehydrogenase/fumarate reductase flavoprotein subunit